MSTVRRAKWRDEEWIGYLMRLVLSAVTDV